MTTIGAMFGDVFKSLFKKPVTEKYPFERKPDPERLRGKLFWNAEKCTGCQMCVRDCPANALELVVIDRASKKFVMKYHAERCTFCNQCVFSCKFGCLNLSHEDWELATLQQEPMTISYGREEDIRFLLEKAAQPDNPETEKECK